MASIATKQRMKLDKIIQSMEMSKHDFVLNPKKDFTRNRKLRFGTVLQASLSMRAKSLSKEMLVPKRFLPIRVSTSAFIQQRSKLKTQAFRHLFDKFNETINIKTHKNYQILALDGTSIQITTNKQDADSYSNNQHGGYNYLHLNVLYDVCTGTYIDVLIQAANTSNELKALYSIIERNKFTKPTILLADRGYESYNLIETMKQRDQHFLFRIKDIYSRGGIGLGLHLNVEGECDMQITRILTRKQNKTTRNSDTYRFMAPKVRFDFIKDGEYEYPISFRLIRIKIKDDLYETLVTNLSEDEFSTKEIKNLYSMRWAIETAFRDIKYSLGLVRLHSKKYDFLEMEILCRMTMYNFIQSIVSKKSKNKRVLQRQRTRSAY